MSEPQIEFIPPPLPPRNRPPGPPESLQPATKGHTTSSTSGQPPPLPPRTSHNGRSPSPSPVSPTPIITLPEPSAEEALRDITTPRVGVIPATPPDTSPVDQVRPSFGQGGEDIQTAPLPNDQATAIKQDHLESSTPASPVPPPLPSRTSSRRTKSPKPTVTAQPLAKDKSIATAVSSVTVEWLILGVLIANLFYAPSWVSVPVIVVSSYFIFTWLRARQARSVDLNPPKQERLDQGNISFINHALFALFPLISTDILTPFIDLLEDALIQQVPAIVTSVRLTSASLGSQPVILNTLRPMSDEEWFAFLSPSSNPRPTQKDSTDQSAASHTPGWTKGHVSQASKGYKSPKSSLSRSVSGSSAISARDTGNAEREVQKRRKRDRILQSISRRKRASGGRRTGASDGSSAPLDHAGGQRPDGDVDLEGDEDDPDVGEYVNFQVGFEYDRPRATKKAAWGLHMLAYFGWGVKGVGKSEIPVYIDVLSFKGKVNLRLLLSATPPFVRTATMSLPDLPEFDISATPLKKGAFNAMELPGMKTYVTASIKDVASAFLHPESFTLDVDRLLLGAESALRTHSVGVLHIVIHSADDLPKTDTMGSCDPYVAISYTKFHKPVFSTRTIIDTRSPVWEEEAFVLVSSDAIESGERLRLRLCDSDRFSADDAMGVVEVDLADLCDQSASPTPDVALDRRRDTLKADRPGMKVAGSLEWSVRFCPLWQMSEKDVGNHIQSKQVDRPGEPEEEDMVVPWWMEWLNKYMDVPDWEIERKKRRSETLAYFTGDREREEMEAAAKPSDELRSGVLQFHIHQCSDLEVESLEGTYSSTSNPRLSAASGKPALADVIDRTPAEDPDPPSAYCEVYLNDRLVYRTRTKQLTPLPYFNAVSERFVRDWRMAKIVFVVRDERDREHDPILGLVSMRLKDALADRSHFTRWFPLVGGLGWGRIRLSLLFKPIEIRLPPRVSGYEVATLEIAAISATDMSRYSDRSLSVVIQTDSDKFTMEGSDGPENATSPSKSRASLDLNVPTTPKSARSFDLDNGEVEWELTKPIRLAVEYRHSCSVVVQFVSTSKVVKKKRVVALGIVRLDDCPDNEQCERTVPIFATGEVKDAVKGSIEYSRARDAQIERPTSPTSPGGRTTPKIVGFINLTMLLHPGVSIAHRKICKKDLRFAKVYETWETAREVESEWDKTSAGDMLRSTKDKVMRGDQQAEDEESDESDTTEDEYEDTDGVRRSTSIIGGKKTDGFSHESPGINRGEINLEEEEGFFSERKAHSHALHKRHKGIFQLKIARTGRFVKDKLEAKMYSTKRERQRGADLEVEHEGLSSL